LYEQLYYLRMQGDVKPLSELELGAWRGMLRAHASLARGLDAELEAAHGISLSAYEVLLLLHEAPDQRLRMSELAESALLSLSGMTRLVDRLVQAGLVERERCADDRRVLYARPTRAGTSLFAAARATHLRGVRERFLGRFADSDLSRLDAYWRRLE
jgi:DNA-binding MarR family transcriptional regulator